MIQARFASWPCCRSATGASAARTRPAGTRATAHVRHRSRRAEHERDRLGRHQERREVVDGHGGGARERPPPHGPAVARLGPSGPHGGEHGDRAGQRQQRVRARLLRVPDQHRVHGDEQGGEAGRGPSGAQLAGEGGHHRDRRHAGDEGQRPQRHLAVAGQARPQPDEGEERRRDALPVGDVPQEVGRPAVHGLARQPLVVPEALGPDAPHAQRQAGHDQPHDHRVDRPPRPHPAQRLPSPPVHARGNLPPRPRARRGGRAAGRACQRDVSGWRPGCQGAGRRWRREHDIPSGGPTALPAARHRRDRPPQGLRRPHVSSTASTSSVPARHRVRPARAPTARARRPRSRSCRP